MSLDNEKRNLNVAMGRNTTEEFRVENNTVSPENLALEELVEASRQENIALQINRQNLTVNEMNLQLINAEKQPTVSASASYDFSYTDSPVGAFIDESNSRGLGGNVAVNWTIFDGTRKVRRQNTVINMSTQKLQIEELQQQLEREDINARTE